jgi:4'-phosphopantetheinyl transferase
MAWPFPAIWESAPPEFTLHDNDVHLWLAAVPDCLPHLESLRELLDAEERDRAVRFHFQRDRERYIIARGVLRRLLATYLSTSHFAFTVNKFGKPSLQPPHNAFHFNVSHSRDLVLFGFTRGLEIGADVEAIRPDFATLEIANRFFAPDEAVTLTQLSDSERIGAFFNCWTRKEAYIKARGIGLSLGLSTFAVTLKPGERAALTRVDNDATAPNRWTLLSLDVGADYRAAVAFEARDCNVSCFRWGGNPS